MVWYSTLSNIKLDLAPLSDHYCSSDCKLLQDSYCNLPTAFGKDPCGKWAKLNCDCDTHTSQAGTSILDPSDRSQG